MRKIVIILIVFILMTTIFVLSFKKPNCAYPVFDLNHKGQVITACFRPLSLIRHEHKNSLMVEVVGPEALASDESFFFANEREMELFACRIVFQNQDKQPTRYDAIPSISVPGQKVIRPQNNSLSSSDIPGTSIINRLFCVADK